MARLGTIGMGSGRERILDQDTRDEIRIGLYVAVIGGLVTVFGELLANLRWPDFGIFSLIDYIICTVGALFRDNLKWPTFKSSWQAAILASWLCVFSSVVSSIFLPISKAVQFWQNEIKWGLRDKTKRIVTGFSHRHSVNYVDDFGEPQQSPEGWDEIAEYREHRLVYISQAVSSLFLGLCSLCIAVVLLGLAASILVSFVKSIGTLEWIGLLPVIVVPIAYRLIADMLDDSLDRQRRSS
jgi:hypothetical protein